MTLTTTPSRHEAPFRRHAPGPRALPSSHHLAGATREIAEISRRFWYSMRRWWWHSYWQLSVTGLDRVPPCGPVLFCANHASHLDAIAILAALPTETALRTATAAARDVFGEQMLHGSVSRLLTGAVPVTRNAEFPGGLRSLESVLRARRPLILFPEGRRSPDGRLLPFKHGAAMLAIRTGAPIVPVRLGGLRESLARGRHIPKPGPVSVRFGDPIDPRLYRDAIAGGMIDRRTAYNQLTQELRDAVHSLDASPASGRRAAGGPAFT